MGHFEYSSIPSKTTVMNVDAAIRTVSKKLWNNRISPEMVEGVPVSKNDDHLAKWRFLCSDPGWGDAAFSISLVRNGVALKLEPDPDLTRN
jgi:hypothetical protein